MFDRITTYARWVYFLRVQIGIGLVTILLPPLALVDASPLSTLFKNLFFLSTIQVFWHVLLALILSWSLLLTGRTVVHNAAVRFGIPPGPGVGAVSAQSVWFA